MFAGKFFLQVLRLFVEALMLTFTQHNCLYSTVGKLFFTAAIVWACAYYCSYCYALQSW